MQCSSKTSACDYDAEEPMLALLLAAAVEIRLAPPVFVPLRSAASATALASNGDELLAAWVDRRDRAVYATRVSREPRVLDPQGIRFVPPRQPYTSYETPQAAAVPGGWALVFTRRINEHYG